MNEWKSTEWQEKLKRKPVRYIINRFYYVFADYEQYPKVELSYCWRHFRENLKKTNVIRESDYNDSAVMYCC